MVKLIKIYHSQEPSVQWLHSLFLFWNHVTFPFALANSVASLVALTSLALIPQLDSSFPEAFHTADLGGIFLFCTLGILVGLRDSDRGLQVSVGFLPRQFTVIIHLLHFPSSLPFA